VQHSAIELLKSALPRTMIPADAQQLLRPRAIQVLTPHQLRKMNVLALKYPMMSYRLHGSVTNEIGMPSF
jgi:hypothetical protein